LPADLTYVLRVTLDRSLAPESASVTAYEDERDTYAVVVPYGPFDTWEDVLAAMRAGLDEQARLW